MGSNYKKLGGYIRQIDTRNSDARLGEDNLYGISVTKEFIISHANLEGVTFDSYKVVAPRQFAYIPDTSRRGDKIAISLNTFGEEIIVSSICSVFEIIDEDELLPEYLMLWFMRPEFDRYARFMSNGSAREVFDWDSMCGVELPVPSLPEQRKIVHDYQVITDRIELLRKMNENLEEQAMAVFESRFVNPSDVVCDENGVPDGWIKYLLSDVMKTTTNSVNPQTIAESHVWHYSIPAFDAERLPVFDSPNTILSNKYRVPADSILVSKLNPDTKRIWLSDEEFKDAICSTEFIIYIPENKKHKSFYYMLFNTKAFVDFLVSNATGSTNSRMRVKPLSTLDFTFAVPDEKAIEDYSIFADPFLRRINENNKEMRQLKKLWPIATTTMMLNC